MLVFARAGIALPQAGAAARGFRVNGAPVAAQPLPGGGWWLPTRWGAGRKVRLSWNGAGGEREATLSAPLRPTPFLWRRLPWRSAGGGMNAGVTGITTLAFSADGALLAVGGGGGRIAVYGTGEGRSVWSALRPGRVIKHLAFSPDGKTLFVGEQGPEGRLAAYDLGGGSTRPRWVLDTAEELGRPAAAAPGDAYGWVQNPGAYRLLAVGEDILAAYTHSWNSASGRIATARLYRLRGADGSLRWSYPAGAPAGRPLPMLITWFAASGRAERLALPLQLPVGAELSGGGGGRVVVLDGGSGQVSFDHAIPPLPPYALTGFWRGVAFNPRGTRLAASTEDGRGFLFAARDGRWRLARTLELVSPLRLGDTIVTATNGTVAATAAEALFITGPSFVPLPFREDENRAAGNHPRGNTVFAYGWDGELRWIRRLENDLQGLATDGGGRLLALAQGRAQPQGAGDFNGMTLLRLEPKRGGRGELVFRVGLEGRAVYGGVAVSPDGKWLALAEGPRELRGDPRPRGGHGVLLLR